MDFQLTVQSQHKVLSKNRPNKHKHWTSTSQKKLEIIKIKKVLLAKTIQSLHPEIWKKQERKYENPFQTNTSTNQLSTHSERRQTRGTMFSFNSLKPITLVVIMTSINLCMALANPVKRSAKTENKLVTNKELPIKPKEGLFNETDRVMVDSMGKPVKTSSVIIQEEEESASWETARCILDSRYMYVHCTSHIFCLDFLSFITRSFQKEGEALRPHIICPPWHLWHWLVLPLCQQVINSSWTLVKMLSNMPMTMTMRIPKYLLTKWFTQQDIHLGWGGEACVLWNWRVLLSSVFCWQLWHQLQELQGQNFYNREMVYWCFRTWSHCWLALSSLPGGWLTGSGPRFLASLISLLCLISQHAWCGRYNWYAWYPQFVMSIQKS